MERRGRKNGPEEGKIPTASQPPPPVFGFPMGPARSLAVGRPTSQQLYMEAEQQATEGILLFKPTTLLN